MTGSNYTDCQNDINNAERILVDINVDMMSPADRVAYAHVIATVAVARSNLAMADAVTDDLTTEVHEIAHAVAKT